MILFSEYRLGSLVLKNRVVMAPMTRSRALGNVPNATMREYYRQRAAAGLIVTEGIHDRFVAAMQERMQGLVIDDALKAGTHIGPVVDQSQLDQDLKYIKIGQDEGAKLHWGGELLNRDKPGFYLQPAVFTDVTNKMRIAREEIFGPVAAVIKAKDYDEALAISNAMPGSPQASLTLEVANLDASLKAAKAEGITMAFDVMEFPPCRMFAIKDPDGNQIGLHQRKAGA